MSSSTSTSTSTIPSLALPILSTLQDTSLLLVPFALLGALTSLYALASLLRGLHHHFLFRSRLPRYLAAKPTPSSGRPWALITGATDGIGYGFAQELLTAGFDVILHGRNPGKLTRVRTELASAFPDASVRTVELDAVSATRDQIDGMVRTIQTDIIGGKPGGKLTMLVNNVGGRPGGPAHSRFGDVPVAEVDGYTAMNAGFPARLTHAVLAADALTEPALVFNMGSAAARAPCPYLVMYTACKTFNSGFSRVLAAEMEAEGRDVEVLGLCVGRVANQWERSTFFGKPDARTFARACLGKVGCGRHEVVPYWVHALQIWGMGWLEALAPGMAKGYMIEAAKQGFEIDRLNEEREAKEKEARQAPVKK